MKGNDFWKSNCYDFENEMLFALKTFFFFFKSPPSVVASPHASFLGFFVTVLTNYYASRKSTFLWVKLHTFKRKHHGLLKRPQVQLMWLCMTGCGAEQKSYPTNVTPPTPKIITPYTEVRSRRRMLWLQGCKFTTVCVRNARQTGSTLLYMFQQGAWYCMPINSQPSYPSVVPHTSTTENVWVMIWVLICWTKMNQRNLEYFHTFFTFRKSNSPQHPGSHVTQIPRGLH